MQRVHILLVYVQNIVFLAVRKTVHLMNLSMNGRKAEWLNRQMDKGVGTHAIHLNLILTGILLSTNIY